MKRLIGIMLVLTLTLLFSACNAGQAETTSVESQNTSSITSLVSHSTPSDVSEESQDTVSDNSSYNCDTSNDVGENSSQVTAHNETVTITSINGRKSVGSDIWYDVTYLCGNSDESQNGYMDLAGVISSEEPNKLYATNNAKTSFTLYDAEGNETYSSPEDGVWQVLSESENGTYIVQELRSGLDEFAVYIGLMDNTGNWLSESPVNLTEIIETRNLVIPGETESLGEGMVSAYCMKDHGNYLLLFNTDPDTDSESFIPIENVWNHFLHFYNGTMIFQHWNGGQSGGHKGNIASIDKAGNYLVLPAEGDLLATGENGFLTDANGLSFYNKDGELIWNFNDYELSQSYDPMVYDNVVFAGFTGADGNTYVGCLSQENGTLLYEPIKAVGPIYGHVLLNTVGENSFVDLMTGEVISTVVEFELDDIEYSTDGIIAIRNTNNNGVSYLLFDSEGEPINPVVKED